MRVMTLEEVLLQQLNEIWGKDRDVRVVLDRPRPKLAADRGEVVPLPQPEQRS